MVEVNTNLNQYDYYQTAQQSTNSSETDNIQEENIFCDETQEENNEISSFISPQKDSALVVDTKKRQDGLEFLEGIEKYEDVICDRLNIDEDEYEGYTCLALAIAAQETDTGDKTKYSFENLPIIEDLISFAKNIEMFFEGTESYSSGLTQMKIYDFLYSGKLNDEESQLLQEIGVTAESPTENNLYDNPDLAAASTIVALNNINDTYDDYLEKISQYQQETLSKLGDKTPEECYSIGKEKFESFLDFYENIENSKTQNILRDKFEDWVMSVNNSKKDTKGVKNENNEEINLNELNKYLNKIDADITFEQSDLDYMRYYLSQDTNVMTRSEYCAYSWQHGVNDTSMQYDRLLDSKISSLLKDPEKFDYSQYVPSVVEMANMYSQQLYKGKNFINEALS